jgi:dipeptidyl aminopeptidase/acylaminoacyl peptidase
VLPAELSQDGARLRRFEKEARAASALNHPNIVTIYEVGSAEGVEYIAMELVVGRTLRDAILGGPLPARRLLGIAAPLADGLAAAHEAGIVHRDLKPENVMVTKDGVVKILDFGLAKLVASVGSGDESLPTVSRTEPGGLLGTVSYMSPEQAAGQPADFRSDQFAFGSILHEMASGRRAFQRGTGVDTLAAILHDEPEPLGGTRGDLPVPLIWLIERCLAKDPGGRYASTRDLARDLATLRERSSDAGLTVAAASAPAPRSRPVWWLGAAAMLALGALAGRFVDRDAHRAGPPVFRRLTFRRGSVTGARFAPDGQNVVYSARWDAEPESVFMTRVGGGGSLPLSLPPGSRVLALSRMGELAIQLLDPTVLPGTHSSGTLATVPLTGGAPRPIAEDVLAADWSSDGKSLAIQRAGKIEFPMGKVLDSDGDMLRVSPKGDRVAFGHSTGDVVGDRVVPQVAVVDLSGRRTEIGRGQRNMYLVWRPDGREVWYVSGSGWGNADTVEAATLAGKTRVVTRIPGFNVLEDFAPDGRLLLAIGRIREEAYWLPPGETAEREAGWFGGSHADALSADGRGLLVNEFGEGGGLGTAYLRRADGSPAVKLTDGFADALSPDGKFIACRRADGIRILPTGAGETKLLSDPRLEYGGEVEFSADGRRVVFAANERGKGSRLWIQEISGGAPRPLTAEGVECRRPRLSPDGRSLAAETNGGPRIYPVDGGEGRSIPRLLARESVIGWSEDSHSVFAADPDRIPFHVSLVDVSTGDRKPWKTIGPADPAGIFWSVLRVAPNGAYALTVGRYISDLYLVEGLK